MMAAPSSPMFCKSSSSLKSGVGVSINSKPHRNSLVRDHEDMLLLREKLARIAVGRHHVGEGKDTQREDEEHRRGRFNGLPNEHFKIFPLLLSERPNTPPSSPQPRDVLRKQYKSKQQSRQLKISSQKEDGDVTMSVDELEVTAMEDVEDCHAVHSPLSKREYRRKPQARLSIPGHLRIMSAFSILNKYPEGLKKRKSVHTADGEDEQRSSLKKTSSQINILATTAEKVLRSRSVSGEDSQTLAAKKKIEQDQVMEDASGCTSQPHSPQNALYANKHGHLSACS